MITCDVIQDLLPLYEDNCCSEQSKKLVEQHLKACSNCGKKHKDFIQEFPQNIDLEEVETTHIRKGMRNIIRWKVTGIALLATILATVFLILPVWNQICGQGITYANLKAVQTAYGFERALANHDYEKAYTYLDIEGNYHALLDTDTENEKVMEGIREIKDKGFEWYNETAKERFINSMKILEEMNQMVTSYSRFYIIKQPYGWCVHFDYVLTDSNEEIEMQLDITSDGIKAFNGAIKSVSMEDFSEGMSVDKDTKDRDLVLSRLYMSPTTNETVMKILYDETEFEWEKLFEY